MEETFISIVGKIGIIVSSILLALLGLAEIITSAILVINSSNDGFYIGEIYTGLIAITAAVIGIRYKRKIVVKVIFSLISFSKNFFK